jgi:hypothetical protein
MALKPFAPDARTVVARLADLFAVAFFAMMVFLHACN